MIEKAMYLDCDHCEGLRWREGEGETAADMDQKVGDLVRVLKHGKYLLIDNRNQYRVGQIIGDEMICFRCRFIHVRR